jgi:soluble P-type ATPase
VAIPGRPEIVLRHLVTDFTGTLAKDGRLLPGVAARLRHLAKDIHIIAATADTFGTARRALAGLPVDVRFVKTGGDKARIIRNLGPTHVVVIGNGQNDVPMFGVAALSVAVVGPEGAAGQVLSAAEVVVGDVKDALDLLANPLRLAATLRE